MIYITIYKFFSKINQCVVSLIENDCIFLLMRECCNVNLLIKNSCNRQNITKIVKETVVNID